MLRINLLPPYIYDKQKKNRLWVIWGAIVAIAAGLFLFWFITLNKQLSDQKDLQAKAEGLKSDNDKVQSDIRQEHDRRKQIEDRQTFIANAQKYNDSWPAALEMMRDVTTNNILLKSMAFDATRKNVSFTGFAKSEADIVKWWMYLRNNYAGPDASLPFDNVSFSLPKHPYPPAGTAAAGGSGLQGGFGGSAGGSGNSAGVAGVSVASNSGGGGFGGGKDRGAFGGGPGGGGTDSAVGPGVIEGRPGINFTASVVLKKPLADGMPTPAWGGGAAPAAPAGFGGGGGRPTAPGGANN